MSYIMHHAILVASWRREDVEKAHAVAPEPKSAVIGGLVNDGASFAVLPDHCKEGWRNSDEMDAKRAGFLMWIEESDLFLDVVEVRFGGDNPEHAEITHRIPEGEE